MMQPRPVAITAGGRAAPQVFQSLALAAPGRGAREGATFVLSVLLHSGLALALAVLPLLVGGTLPHVETMFDAPTTVEIRLLPPPPAGPAGGTRPQRLARRVEPQARGFVAPVDVSSEIRPDDPFADLDGGPDTVLGGVPGLGEASEGVGSVVHVPEQTPTPPPPLVRVSQIAAPQPVVRVPPRYPKLAIDIGLSGMVVVEAEVDTTGRVRTVRALSGHKLLVDAALEAVSQWRYQPMLLNGEPTAFILNVKVEFTARRG